MRADIRLFVGFFVFALTMALTPLVGAQTSDEETFVTFSHPIELPGVALPAGTYLFRLPDGPDHPQIVQVLSQDRSKVYAMLLGVNRTLLEPSKSPVEMFNEAAPGSPLAVRMWFPPDDRMIGVEFIYPKPEAQRIASATNEHVLTVS